MILSPKNKDWVLLLPIGIARNSQKSKIMTISISKYAKTICRETSGTNITHG